MKRLIVILSVILLVLGTGALESVLARSSKAKSKRTVVSKKRGKASVKANSVKRRGKVKVKRVSRRQNSYLVRLRALDSSLLRTAEDEILKDELSGEDREMRRVALKALGGHPGTVVLMNPNNGRVYSIVNQAWALGKPFKPCSTIKLLTSIAALNEGLVDPDLPMDLGYGVKMNMIEALARSNNEYFQIAGDQVGLPIIRDYALQWGLGRLTGINMPGESPGYLPEYKSDAAFPRVCSHGDDIGVTALQLAVMTSAIANGGRIYQPQVVRSAREEAEFQPRLLRTVHIDEHARKKIIEGMLGAVTFGSARRSGVAYLNVAGKTGSCNGQESKLGLFASFFSPDNPDLVAVVITTGSSERGSQSAVIAGEIYNELSNGKFARADRPRRAQMTAQQFDQSNAQDEDDEEDEDEEQDEESSGR